MVASQRRVYTVSTEQTSRPHSPWSPLAFGSVHASPFDAPCMLGQGYSRQCCDLRNFRRSNFAQVVMILTNAELPLLKRVGYLRSSRRYSLEPLSRSSVGVKANPNTVRVRCSPILTIRYNQVASMSCDVHTLNVRSCLNSAYHRV